MGDKVLQRDSGAGRQRKTKIDVGTKAPPPRPDQLGLTPAIARLQHAEFIAHHRYLEQLTKTKTSPQDIAWVRKEWLDLCETLRKLEKDAPSISTDKGDSIPKSDVEAVLGKAILTFKRSLLAKAKALPPELVGKDQIEIMQALTSAFDEVLTTLATKPWEDK